MTPRSTTAGLAGPPYAPRAGAGTGETAQLLVPTPAAGALWTPVPGTETDELLRHLRIEGEGAERVQREAVGVLGRCLPPGSAPGRATGLVVGYVQSGKTMSFTTVAALARDHD